MPAPVSTAQSIHGGFPLRILISCPAGFQWKSRAQYALTDRPNRPAGIRDTYPPRIPLQSSDHLQLARL